MAHISERLPASQKRPPSLDSAKEKLPKDIARDVTDDLQVARGLEEQGEENLSLGLYPKLRPYILAALALSILGWWISATVLQATRHRWYVLYVPPLASKSLTR